MIIIPNITFAHFLALLPGGPILDLYRTHALVLAHGIPTILADMAAITPLNNIHARLAGMRHYEIIGIGGGNCVSVYISAGRTAFFRY